jgi:uncharacterized integral membrane protein
MQIVRTLAWVLVTALLVAFIAMNWEQAPVNIWPLQEGYLYFEWPVGIIALVFFLLGLVPMWLVHRAGRWRWQRRVTALEHSVRLTATPSATPPGAPSAAPPPPLVTTGQPDAGSPEASVP